MVIATACMLHACVVTNDMNSKHTQQFLIQLIITFCSKTQYISQISHSTLTEQPR